MDRLKVIGTFVQIARSGTLSRAAADLGISTALASSHLKQLEQHLGVHLVNRTTRKLVLTDAGKEYLSFCTEVLDRFEAHEMDVIQSQRDPAGNLKIMGSMAFMRIEVAPIVASFASAYPKIKLSLTLGDPSFSPGGFVEGGHDLGIVTHPISDARLVALKIADVSWVLCASPEYLRDHPPVCHPEALKGHNCLIHRAYAPDGVWTFANSVGAYDISVTGSLAANSAEALHAAVLSGVGIAMLPLYSVREDISEGRLVPLLPDYNPVKRPAYVVFPHGRYLPKRARLFVEFLKDQLRTRML
jgi:DNA-binding transcriptional LysR family regulator